MPKNSHKDMEEWRALISKMDNAKTCLEIAITGKYTALHDAYISIEQALKTAAGGMGSEIKLRWVETTDIETGKVKVEDGRLWTRPAIARRFGISVGRVRSLEAKAIGRCAHYVMSEEDKPCVSS
jgi:CTP synthase (UTP-ammonia lyase)